MASIRHITLRVAVEGPSAYRRALALSPLAAGFDAGRRERGLDRLALAIAESAREDAEADAAALKANRDLLQGELRAARLALNESETLLGAARCVGRQQLREIGELHSLLEIGELHSLLAEEAGASKNVSRRIDEKVAERVGDLVQRIDVYQCELAGMHAEQAESESIIRDVLANVTGPHPTAGAREALIERLHSYVNERGGA